MRKLFASILSLVLLAACQEWDPVFNGKYGIPPEREPMVAVVNTTIAELKQMYIDNGGKAVEITGNVVICGQVVSSDRSGNIYRELYIQDETGAICVKIGKSSLYSDYRLGQWVSVDCAGLKIGSYSGMPQLGVEDESGEYDTAYIDAQYLLDRHIYRGREAEPPAPRVVTAEELSQALADGGFKSPLWGSLVTLKGMTYGAKADRSTDSYKRIFAILYIDDNQDNRVFLGDRTYGVTTWAMSKAKLLEHIAAGSFNGLSTQGGRKLEGEVLDALIANASPVTMSQYFNFENVQLQIRTSGYSKFADSEVPTSVIDITGILTLYDDSAQFTLIDLDGVKTHQNE